MSEFNSSLDDRRVAVVTGASSGIGAASARALAAEGFKVYCAARRIDRLADLATEIGGVAVACDVTDQADVARVFRFSPYTRIREIVVPHAMPSIITGLRLSMGVAWMVIVAAEMLAASSGIGFYIWQSYNGQGLAYVLSAVILIGGTGVILDLAFQALGRLVTHTEARS